MSTTGRSRSGAYINSQPNKHQSQLRAASASRRLDSVADLICLCRLAISAAPICCCLLCFLWLLGTRTASSPLSAVRRFDAPVAQHCPGPTVLLLACEFTLLHSCTTRTLILIGPIVMQAGALHAAVIVRTGVDCPGVDKCQWVHLPLLPHVNDC